MAELFLLMVSLFSLSIDITLCSNRQNEEYKCCVPEEWRGTVFLSSGSSLTPMNLTLYTNGTALLAYNIKLDKLYLGMEVIHQSPQLPQPLHTNWTILYDFTKGIMYDIESGECDKTNLDRNATIQQLSCIPARAQILSRATLGDDDQTTVTTYRFLYPENKPVITITATVKGEGVSSLCDPVSVTYASFVETTGGLMYSFDVFDIGPLNSTEVFNIPKQCL